MPVGEHELPFENHERLEAAPVHAAVQHPPAFDRPRPHEYRRWRKAPVDRRWRRDASLAPARTGIDVDREHLDPLDEHQPLAIVVRTGLDARIRSLSTGHRPVDRIVHVAFDNQEAGQAARNLIVRRAVRMGVIPVGSGGMRLHGAARPAARTLHVAELQFVVSFGDAFVRSQRSAARSWRRLACAGVFARQDAQECVVAGGPV